MPHGLAGEPSKDFARLRQGGHRRGTSRAIGQGFVTARDALARGLIRAGVTPNMLTIAGFVCTCGAAVALFRGGGYSHAEAAAAALPDYPLIAAGFLFLASAFDMLDGAVARIGGLKTPLGAVLDSSIDRFSDLVLYIALIGHFVLRGNLTYCLLAAVAMSNAFLISYVKARSETLIPDCSVGYWLRGERYAALLIAAFAGTYPTVLWQQAISPLFTVVRRLAWTYQVLAAQAAGRHPPSPRPAPGMAGLLRPWRYPRGSIPYDVVTSTNIAFIIAASYLSPLFAAAADPLRGLAAR